VAVSRTKNSESFGQIIGRLCKHPKCCWGYCIESGLPKPQISVFKEALKSINPNLNKQFFIFLNKTTNGNKWMKCFAICQGVPFEAHKKANNARTANPAPII